MTGTTHTVAASTAGNVNANDVNIGGVTYDVYQYQYGGQTLNLLLATAVATNVISSPSPDAQSVWSLSAPSPTSEGAGFITYTVARTSATGAATIVFATAGGTATAGSDYTAASQILTFAVGEVSKTVQVAVANDTAIEVNETLVGVISNASSGTIATAAATASLLDNDQSVWSVSAPTSVSEGAGGITYTVSRTGATGAGTIVFATAGGTATAGSDYTAVNQTLTFAAGETSKTVQVAVTNDTVAEVNETLVGVISTASSGSILTSSARVSLTDNDATSANTYAIAVTSNNVFESAGSVSYTITRSGDLSLTSTSYFRTGTGTATAGSDFSAVVRQTLNWAAGEASKVVLVNLTNDAIVEASETVIGQLALDADFTVGLLSATATVLDDEPTGLNTYAIAVTSSNVLESTGSLGYTITRSGDLTQASTSYFRTTPSYVTGTVTTTATAAVGTDYTAIAGHALSWAVGETSKVVLVSLVNNDTAEANETIIGQSANNSTFTTGLVSVIATVVDDEAAAVANTYSIASTGGANVLESTGVVDFTITRAGSTVGASTSYFRANTGTATAGTDYTAITSQTLSWAAGEIRKVVLVSLVNNTTQEGNETVIGQVATNSTFTTGLVATTITVLDDDTYVAPAGAVNTITTGTAIAGGYAGGYLINTGDLNDVVTIGNLQQNWTSINLGEGNDTLNAAVATNILVDGAHYLGGAGVDTLATTQVGAVTLSTLSVADVLTGFEIINLSTGNQTLSLGLNHVAAMTTGNIVAGTLRIVGTAGDVINLDALGKTLSTPAVNSTITDVTGTTHTVAASTAGNASTNDVNIGGVTYDVYQYQYGGQTLNLLLATAVATNVI